MTTQPRIDGDTYTPAVRIGQGDYIYDWPPRPTAQPATIDLDEQPGISDGAFAILVGMAYMLILTLVVLAVLTWFGTLTWNWSM